MTSYQHANDPDEVLEGEIVEEGFDYYSSSDLFVGNFLNSDEPEVVNSEVVEDEAETLKGESTTQNSILANQNEAMDKLRQMAQSATMPAASNADEAKKNINDLQNLISRFTQR